MCGRLTLAALAQLFLLLLALGGVDEGKKLMVVGEYAQHLDDEGKVVVLASDVLAFVSASLLVLASKPVLVELDLRSNHLRAQELVFTVIGLHLLHLLVEVLQLVLYQLLLIAHHCHQVEANLVRRVVADSLVYHFP